MANMLAMAISLEKRTAALGMRVQPTVKAALEQAAADDSRPVASLVEKVLIEWLIERDYLKKDVTY